MAHKKRQNVFLRVRLLSGKEIVYQVPNDLRYATLQCYYEGELKHLLQNALINVPTTPYTKDGNVTLHVGLITSIFVQRRSQKRRTRGQFLTEETWTRPLEWEQIKFLLHDHSFFNKCRIFIDLYRWKWRARMDPNNYD